MGNDDKLKRLSLSPLMEDRKLKFFVLPLGQCNLKLILIFKFSIRYTTRRDDYNPSFLHLNDEYFHALPSDLRCISYFLYYFNHIFFFPFVILLMAATYDAKYPNS